jgi:Flp pilus assembly protein TadD
VFTGATKIVKGGDPAPPIDRENAIPTPEPNSQLRQIPAGDTELQALEKAARGALTAKEALGLYATFRTAHTLTAAQQATFNASLRTWEDRSKLNLVRLGKNWVAATDASRAHREGHQLFLQAVELINDQKFAEAVKVLEAASRTDPNSIASDFTLGLLHSITSARLLNPLIAEMRFRTVLQRRPDYVPALNNLAIVQIRGGKFVDAERNLQQATKCVPIPEAVTQNLGRFINEAKRERIRPSKVVLAAANKLYEVVITSKKGMPWNPKRGWQFIPLTAPNGDVQVLPHLSYDDIVCSACNGSRRIKCRAGCVHGSIYGERLEMQQVNGGSANHPVLTEKATMVTTRMLCPQCGGTGYVKCPFCKDGTDPDCSGPSESEKGASLSK